MRVEEECKVGEMNYSRQDNDMASDQDSLLTILTYHSLLITYITLLLDS